MAELIQIREITRDAWEVFRDLRLAALLDAPLAFGSSYDLEAGRTDEQWQEPRRWSNGARFVAEIDGARVGIAAVYLRTEERDPDPVPELVSMWVDPDYRGTGVGRALVDAVAEWVIEHGFAELRLMVAADNPEAERFYERLGFARNGYVQPMPHHEDRPEIEMTRALGCDYPTSNEPMTVSPSER